MAKRVVDVLVPVALDQAYSYRVPEALELAPGDVVCVPLGAREATARGLGGKSEAQSRLDNRLKDVAEKLDVPPLKPELRKFVDWVAELHASARAAWCCAWPAHGRASRGRARARRRAARRAAAAAMTPARARVLALFADGIVRGKSDAAREAGVSAGVIDGLIDEGTLETVVLPPEPVADRPIRISATGILARPARRRRRAANDGRPGRLYGDAARRRHRLGQDRSLFRGGGGKHPRAAGRP